MNTKSISTVKRYLNNFIGMPINTNTLDIMKNSIIGLLNPFDPDFVAVKINSLGTTLNINLTFRDGTQYKTVSITFPPNTMDFDEQICREILKYDVDEVLDNFKIGI